MANAPYTLEFYQDDAGREPVLEWLRSLSPRKRRALGVAMFEILQYEGPNVVTTRYGRQLGDGLFEFRLDEDAAHVLAGRGKPSKAEQTEPARLLRVFCQAIGVDSSFSSVATTRASTPESGTSSGRSRSPVLA
jgi:hypothetical protein